MDKDSLMYGMDVLDEINGALEPIGLTVRKLDAEETQGLPVGPSSAFYDSTKYE